MNLCGYCKKNPIGKEEAEKILGLCEQCAKTLTMVDLREKIDTIDIELNNLQIKKRGLISEHLEPIANDVVKDLRQNRKRFVFDFSVDNPAWDDEDCYYVIHIRFPNGYTFKERLKYKHEIIDYVHGKIEDDYALSRMMITGAI